MTYLCALSGGLSHLTRDPLILDFSGAAVGPKTSGGCVKTEVAQATIRWGKP